MAKEEVASPSEDRMSQTPSPFQQGLAAAEARDFARAEAIARSLLARNRNDVSGLQILGYSYFSQGRNSEALQAFLRANQVAPGQPALLYWLGVLFKERGDFDQAARAFSDAVRINPAYGEAHCHLGETLFLLDKTTEATAAFERAIESEPNSPTVLAKAARHFEKTHALDRARILAEQALKLAPDNEIALIALSELDLRDRRDAEIVDRLAPVLSVKTSNARNASRLFHILASAYDRLGDYENAIAAYARTNALSKKMSAARITEEISPLTARNLDRMTAFFAAEDLDAWPRPEGLAGPSPVFLVGFVRSGTTWLDQILSSHPAITVMEEEDNFVDAWRAFALSDTGLQNLRDASRDEINKYRAAYWRRAGAFLQHAPEGGMVVDKVPLNTAMLGLINRLFPEAKIIFAIRDPRDAVMSAYQQHFQINTSMFQFLEMETAAAFYDRIMSFGALMRAKSRLAFFDVRYEDVVADLEGEIRKLISFLGLEWTDALLAYDETAKKRAIRTPSAKQVIQRPYSSSIGKWRNYRAHMAPALPVLAPWVDRFGYDPD